MLRVKHSGERQVRVLRGSQAEISSIRRGWRSGRASDEYQQPIHRFCCSHNKQHQQPVRRAARHWWCCGSFCRLRRPLCDGCDQLHRCELVAGSRYFRHIVGRVRQPLCCWHNRAGCSTFGTAQPVRVGCEAAQPCERLSCAHTCRGSCNASSDSCGLGGTQGGSSGLFHGEGSRAARRRLLR